MAFNFFGTFTTGQFLKFTVFSKYQEKDINKRIDWLNAELQKIGVFITEYDDNDHPVSFTVTPSDSYAAKLLLAYKVFGGNPEQEMLLRTRDKPVYLKRGTSLGNDPMDTTSGQSTEYTNGRTDRGGQRFDRDLGIQVWKLKHWQLESIKRKREALEFKIKKALDYSDQLSEEKKLLNNMVSEDTMDVNSVDYRIARVASFMFANGAMNIVQSLLDIFGLKIGPPGDVTHPSDMMQQDAQNLRVPGGSTDQTIGDPIEASQTSNTA